MLNAIGSGVTLTASGYLPKALVLEGVERDPRWHPFSPPPRSEADVRAFGHLRELAERTGALRKVRRELRLSPKGRAMADDPTRAWEGVVGVLGGEDAFSRAVLEFALTELVTAGPLHPDALNHRVHDHIGTMGWHSETSGERPTPLHVHSVKAEVLRAMRILGFLESRGTGLDRTIELSGAGIATALAYLRLRATGPRHSPFG